MQRFAEGYDLREVIAEYRLLRRVVLEMYAERGDISEESRPKLLPLTVMNEAIDRAIADAVDHHALQTATERERFIAILGHDLRDPLNSIVFGLETIRARVPTQDDTAQGLVNRLSRSVRRMSAMIADMLDFSRGRLGGGLPVATAPADARDIVVRVTEEMALAHPERDIQSRTSGGDGDFHVHWDADRIAQAVANLLSNAITHGADPVIVEVDDAGPRVGISVVNRGEVSTKDVPRLFQPFVSGNSQHRDGLGLGLYIVQEITRAHGGEVEVRSRDGQTRVRLILPRSIDDAKDRRAALNAS